MPTLTFHLPDSATPGVARELDVVYFAGGPDNMPFPCRVSVADGALTLEREMDDSGFLVAPVALPGAGRLLTPSATLMERSAPYDLTVELARGKVNQVRCQAADWKAGGLVVSPELDAAVRGSALAFGRAVVGSADRAMLLSRAADALAAGTQAGRQLVDAYISQVFAIRHQRQARLDTGLACPVDAALMANPEYAPRFRRTFNRAVVPMSWHVVEAEEATYDWTASDEMLAWAEDNDFEPIAGPLVDFSSALLPGSLWQWDRDLPSMATFMCRFAEAAVRRYRSRIRRWNLSAAGNWARVLGLSEEELLSLTYRLGEAVRQVDPALEVTVGIAQPWGEYMVPREQTSPFIFADNLIRSGLNLAGLNLELVMGVRGRGSYARDLLDVSRLLDLYALLGVPLHVTLGYPSSPAPDPDADPELSTGAGEWVGGYTPEAQADWAARFGALAMCKTYVQNITWAHFADGAPHQFPRCGLADATGEMLPVMESLADLREKHLR